MKGLTIGKIHALLSNNDDVMDALGRDAELRDHYQCLLRLAVQTAPRFKPIDVGAQVDQRVQNQFEYLAKLLQVKHGINLAYGEIAGYVPAEVPPLALLGEELMGETLSDEDFPPLPAG